MIRYISFELMTIKKIDKKRIIIGRKYKFFVMVDLVSFLRIDQNYDNALGL